MEHISQHTDLYQVNNIYEVDYFCLDDRDTEEPVFILGIFGMGPGAPAASKMGPSDLKDGALV